ncbi:serine acetyltransferase [Turicibacter bilis]|uniref:Serine acetyltransferase n=1 Tax=Turicibacter bilis TaxID=2735723 RepID=A0A9Q9CG42_9FIRM|nr:serine O-acetyltransferase [Turicibacter bilis]MBS3198667.1 serine acetyltransferase [Turicibacter bilis]UUF08314.1 serine acetyltransferase [Turicibacter bilis]
MFKKIKSDYRAYKLNSYHLIIGIFTMNTFYLVLLYRISHQLFILNIPLLPSILRSISLIIFGADISPAAVIGEGFRVAHSFGIVIGSDVVIGKNFQIFQCVTIGGKDFERNGRTMPLIGDNVTVFTSSSILGPIFIGDNVSIGANSLVIKDIPDSVSVGGVPAKILRRIDYPHSLKSLQK